MPDKALQSIDPDRVLFYLPRDADRRAVEATLHVTRFRIQALESLEEGLRHLGDRSVACIVLQQESLHPGGDRLLADALPQQPEWSDLPVLILSSAGARPSRTLEETVRSWSVSLVPRPVGMNFFLSLIEGSARARARQTQIASLIASLRKENDKAQQAERAKSVFLAQVSHDFRTPLTGILGAADALIASEDAETQDMGKLIVDSGQQLLAMVQSLLELTQLETGVEDLLKAVELKGVLAEVAERAETSASDGMAVGLRLSAVPDLKVRAHRDWLIRILLNLVDNALRHAKGEEVSLRARSAGSEVCIEILDTGPGPCETKGDSIFLPLVRSGEGSSLQFGSGMGLAMAKELTLRMGGRIEYRSTRDGCLFSVYLEKPEDCA